MKGRVLIVDDEKNLTLIIQAQLERDGYEVVAFNDSAQAFESIVKENFDCVISDLFMPGMTGTELFEKVKEVKPSVPFIMITAFGTVEVAVTALKKGAFNFITKPFDQAELLATVEEAVKASQKPSFEESFKDIVKRERQSLERSLIDRALKDCAGNVTRAAERLGLSRKGLQLKMKELGFRDPAN